MSARRAAIRRERMERMKIEKHKSLNGDMERAAEQGTLDGRVYALCTICCILKEKYRFSKSKMEKMIYLTNKEAVKFDQPATQLNLHLYQERMIEKLTEISLKVETEDIKENIYIMQRNGVFFSSCALIFVVLHQEFGYSSNSKGTGRLDIIMQYALNEFIKINLDREGHTINWYLKKMEKETGIKLTK